jgi:hypothetical protein
MLFENSLYQSTYYSVLEVIPMNKNLGVVLVIMLVFSIVVNLYLSLNYNELMNNHNGLINDYNGLMNDNVDLINDYDYLVNDYNEVKKNYQEFQNEILFQSEENHTTVTIVYHTNFSMNQQIISLSIPYQKYDYYQKQNHPHWGKDNLDYARNYITPNEPVINKIVNSVKDLTQSQEELANSLLNFVQDKGQGLNIRYYPTTESKYPIETLVEMGGDCDTHSILYGTLMSAAGFDVLLLLSNEKLSDGLKHVAIAVHLENPPEYSLNDIEDFVLNYNGKEYYYAETTNAHWRVGDLPPKFEDLTFQIMPL